jgi:hypothetical protein
MAKHDVQRRTTPCMNNQWVDYVQPNFSHLGVDVTPSLGVHLPHTADDLLQRDLAY